MELERGVRVQECNSVVVSLLTRHFENFAEVQGVRCAPSGHCSCVLFVCLCVARAKKIKAAYGGSYDGQLYTPHDMTRERTLCGADYFL